MDISIAQKASQLKTEVHQRDQSYHDTERFAFHLYQSTGSPGVVTLTLDVLSRCMHRLVLNAVTFRT